MRPRQSTPSQYRTDLGHKRVFGNLFALMGRGLMGLGGMLAIVAVTPYGPQFSFFQGLVLALVGTTLCLMGEGVRRLGQRLAALPGEELLARDERRPILLLRTFDDDRVGAVGSRVRKGEEYLPAFAQGRETLTFEELLVEILQVLGPVITFGRPGEKLPPSGAARMYLAGEWEPKVIELLNRAQYVVLLMGRIAEHKGLSYELRQIIKTSQPEKAIFLMPPVAEEEVRARWEMFRAEGSCTLPIYEGGELAVEFVRWKAPVVHRSQSGDRDLKAYETIFRADGLALTDMQKCGNCGRLLPGDHSFCRDCRIWLK